MLCNKKLATVIVVPCLNEQLCLAQTCASLGFGVGASKTPQDTYLIIVDNGSLDNTLQVARQILVSSKPTSVIIGHEPERGYIPPRHRGNVLAQQLCLENKWDQSQVLILQVDADTIYSANYIDAMRQVSFECGYSTLVEAYVKYPPTFRRAYPAYVDLCNQVDNELAGLFCDFSDDVIVDDKACGYRLGYYFENGGHLREYTDKKEEVHAETSRLYMRFKAKNGTRVKVEKAYVEHSMRKVIERPLLEFATAGFPREKTWFARWEKFLQVPSSLNELGENINHPNVQRAITIRTPHLLGLFSILPAHVARTFGSRKPPDSQFVAKTLDLLPERTIENLVSSPSLLMTDVFNLLDSVGDEMVRAANRSLMEA
jgi:glycosyltransferase involved in cell wall biosynthesis